MVGYLRNRAGVTSLTRLSVHWAERIVATSSSQALRWYSGICTSGYIRSNNSMIFWTRRARSAAVLGRGTSLGEMTFFTAPFVTLGVSAFEFLVRAWFSSLPLSSHLAEACGARSISTTTRFFPPTCGGRLIFGL